MLIFNLCFADSEDTLTELFIDCSVPRGTNRSRNKSFSRKRFRESDHEEENFEHLHLFKMGLIFADFAAFEKIRLYAIYQG